jgi:type II secretory pathway component PulJ
MSRDSQRDRPQAVSCLWLYSIDELRRVVATLEELTNDVGTVNPRPSGWHNDVIQLVKKLLARLLAWYIRPLREFNVCASRSLEEIFCAVENLSTNMVALERRLAEAEKRNATLTESMQEQLEFLHEQLISLQQTAHLEARQHPWASWKGKMNTDLQWDRPQAAPWLYSIDRLRRVVATLEELRNNVGIANPRPSGWHNDLIQPVKKLLARLLAFYIRPLREFNACVSRSLQEIFCAVENLSTNMVALERRLAEAEKRNRNATLAEPMQEQLEFLHEQVKALVNLQQTAPLQARQHPWAWWKGKMSPDSRWDRPQVDPGLWLYSIDELRRVVATLEELRNDVGTVNSRRSGWHNDLIQLVKKLRARLLAWYIRPLCEFNACVSRSLQETFCAVENLSTNMVALERRLAEAEKRNATLTEPMQEQLEFLHERVKALVNLQQTTNLEAPAGRIKTDWGKRGRENSPLCTDTGLRNDRTAYVIGLFGTGRLYINALILQNIGERAKYFRDFIRLHPGPTSMIYSGHATMRHVSRAQAPPAIMSGILEAVRSRFADLIFVYRHPLDSLLTNWVWWRTYIHDHRMIPGISDVYKNTDDLCADLEQNFPELKAFAEGDPNFFAAAPGQRFLSFPEFVEETELFLQSATLTLRLEDFMIDPAKEFSKIVEVMSADLDLSRLCLAPPRAKPYRYLAVKEKVPRFRNFINGLNALTKERIEKLGYSVRV